jgi:hypothetical protein
MLDLGLCRSLNLVFQRRLRVIFAPEFGISIPKLSGKTFAFGFGWKPKRAIFTDLLVTWGIPQSLNKCLAYTFHWLCL